MDVVLVSGGRQVGRTSKLLELSVRRLQLNKNSQVVFVTRNKSEHLEQRTCDLTGVADFKNIKERIHFLRHGGFTVKENALLQRALFATNAKLPEGSKIDAFVFDCDRSEAVSYLLGVSKVIDISAAEVVFLGHLKSDVCVPYSDLTITQM